MRIHTFIHKHAYILYIYQSAYEYMYVQCKNISIFIMCTYMYKLTDKKRYFIIANWRGTYHKKEGNGIPFSSESLHIPRLS